MKRYAEASPLARRWFFLIGIVWLGLVVFTSRFSTYFPLSGSPGEKLAQLDQRTWFTLGAFVLFYAALSVLAVLLAAKAVRTKQWPPAGLAVPFRTRVHDVRSPFKVWFWVVVLICIYCTHIALAGVKAMATHAMLRQALELVSPN